jgi:L-aminopeptidase/D-esterase-like protein
VSQPSIGPRNDITDVAGVRVGHHQRVGRGWLTGTTVVLPPSGTIGAVDVRGGGPGTRDTDALDPVNLVSRVDAVCLTGGSAYGLAAADGVTQWLAARDIGLPVGPERHHVVPIVPSAVLFDLGVGGDFQHRPDASFGAKAAAAARSAPVRQGTVGAGTGAHAERLKGGIGSASVVLGNGITVAALVALNSSGNVFDVLTGELLGASRGIGGEFRHLRTPRRGEVAAHRDNPPELRPLNTTLAVVATDAVMVKHEAKRMAIAAHDGMARAIDPIHQYVDGDVAFALSTGVKDVPLDDPAATPGSVIRPGLARPLALNAVFAAAADVVCRAIVHAAIAATTAGGMISYLDRFPSALRPSRPSRP